MPESQIHLDLVQLILTDIAARYREHRAVAVFADLPTSTRETRPPRIGQFVPDVYVTDVPMTWMFMGEAKTEAGLFLPHTTEQIRTFLDLLQYHHGTFVLSVPWSCEQTARQLVASIIERNGIVGVETQILTGAPRWR